MADRTRDMRALTVEVARALKGRQNDMASATVEDLTRSNWPGVRRSTSTAVLRDPEATPRVRDRTWCTLQDRGQMAS